MARSLAREGEKVCTILMEAVPPNTPIEEVMVGVAGFVAFLISSFYDETVRKQTAISHANLVWEMVRKMEAQARREAEGEQEKEEQDEKETLH